MLRRQFDLRVRHRGKFTCRIVQPGCMPECYALFDCRQQLQLKSCDGLEWKCICASYMSRFTVHRRGRKGRREWKRLTLPSLDDFIRSIFRTISLCIRDEETHYSSRPQQYNRYLGKIVAECDYVIKLHLAVERNVYVRQLQPVIRGDWHVARDIIFQRQDMYGNNAMLQSLCQWSAGR